jgi:hypothetical protein
MHISQLARTVHRLAQYGAWMGLSLSVFSALVTWLVNTDWFVMATNATDTAQTGSFVIAPIQLVNINQMLVTMVLVCGFVAVVSAMCGGLRRQP